MISLMWVRSFFFFFSVVELLRKQRTQFAKIFPPVLDFGNHKRAEPCREKGRFGVGERNIFMEKISFRFRCNFRAMKTISSAPTYTHTHTNISICIFAFNDVSVRFTVNINISTDYSRCKRK